MSELHRRRLRAQQAWRKSGTGPNPTERRILEAIRAAGGLLYRYRLGKPVFALADGKPLPGIGEFDLALAIELGWLRPDPAAPALLPDQPAQRYLTAPEYQR